MQVDNLLQKIYVREQCMNLENKSTNRPNINNIRRPITFNVMETFLKLVNSKEDINYYGVKTFQVFSEFVEDNKDNQCQIQKLNHYIENNIIPKYNDLKSLKYFVENKENLNPLLETIEENIQCDRILRNMKKINKRFDFDKVVKENNLKNIPVEQTIYTLCEFVDTYNIDDKSKYFISLESIIYSIYKNHIKMNNDSIVNEVNDYFLLRESVITDSYLRKMKRALNESVLVSENSKKQCEYIFEKDHYFGNKLDDILNSNNINCSIRDITNEFQVNKLINDIVNESINILEESCYNENVMNNKVSDLIHSIGSIPLAINVSLPFIESEIVNIKNIIKNPFINEMLEKTENELLETGLITFANMLDLHKADSRDIFESYNCIREDASEDKLNNLIKEFKAEQNKSLPKFKQFMNAVYATSPKGIITDTPNILGIVRVCFVLAPIPIPVIGPALSCVNVMVDKLLNIHIDSNQAKRFNTHLTNEKKKMEEKLETADEKEKKNIKDYIACLDKNITKVEDYRNKYRSVEDDDETDEDGEDDDFDIGDDDFDIDFESVINQASLDDNVIYESYASTNTTDQGFIDLYLYTEALSSVLSERESFETFIDCNMDYIVENIEYMAPMIHRCPTLISPSRLYKKVFDYCNEKSYYNNALSVLEESYQNVESYGCMKDIYLEAENAATVKKATKDKFKLNDLKLAFNAMRGKAKELSTKARSVSQQIDAQGNVFIKSMEKAVRTNRREAIIKGSLIPSLSRCIKLSLTFGIVGAVNPVLGLISAFGYLGCSKALDAKERQLIYDEIDTELKVVEKEIQIAENDGDMKRYRFALNYQKKLRREKQRIKYNMKVSGRAIPNANPVHDGYDD